MDDEAFFFATLYRFVNGISEKEFARKDNAQPMQIWVEDANEPIAKGVDDRRVRVARFEMTPLGRTNKKIFLATSLFFENKEGFRGGGDIPTLGGYSKKVMEELDSNTINNIL